MIVAVIRHAKVDMKWKFMMTSAGYDKGCADYDTADVLPVTVRLPETEFERIYVSALPRTTATARQVFADREFESTALINEVPERAGFDTGLRLPMFFWSAVSCGQLSAGSSGSSMCRANRKRGRRQDFAPEKLRSI